MPGIYAHIARNNPAAAERLLDAVEEAFWQIAAQPEIGVQYPTRNPQMKAVRMLPISGNYLVFYRVESDSVRVLYLVHGALHPARLLLRELLNSPPGASIPVGRFEQNVKGQGQILCPRPFALLLLRISV